MSVGGNKSKIVKKCISVRSPCSTSTNVPSFHPTEAASTRHIKLIFFLLQRVVAILPYTKMPDTDELTFQKGDIFFVHNDMGDGWLWVTAHR